MASITVARALTQLKLIKKRINEGCRFLADNGYTHSRALSPLSKEKDLGKNHAEARKKIAETLQSVKDLLVRYRVLSTAITASNLKTIIHTESLGDITVAEALVITQSQRDNYTTLQLALARASSEATKVATAYNSRTLNGEVVKNLDAESITTLEAQPVTFFLPSDSEEASNWVSIITTELDLLVNEANALTVIEIAD